VTRESRLRGARNSFQIDDIESETDNLGSDLPSRLPPSGHSGGEMRAATSPERVVAPVDGFADCSAAPGSVFSPA
jgi:hypothetical protein